MNDGERSALAVATVAYGVGIWFKFGWETALILSALWVAGLVVLFGAGKGENS